METIKYILTGSPKTHGFKTKADFRKALRSNFVEAKNIEDANLLITNSQYSETSKMQNAHRLGVAIVTYSDIATPGTVQYAKAE